MSEPPYPVWDLPTRIFHWSLVLLLPASWASAELELSRIHTWSGYTLLSLVLFRLAWGVVGSRHSRFSDFLRGPRAVWNHLRAAKSDQPGHNPAGGWAVIGMLLLILVQALTGLFATDEVLFDGPFFPSVSEETAHLLSGIHETSFNLLLALVSVHLLAIAYYQWWLRQPLIGAMWRGYRPGVGAASRPASTWLALLILALAIGLVAGLLAFAPAPSLEF